MRQECKVWGSTAAKRFNALLSRKIASLDHINEARVVSRNVRIMRLIIDNFATDVLGTRLTDYVSIIVYLTLTSTNSLG